MLSNVIRRICDRQGSFDLIYNDRCHSDGVLYCISSDKTKYLITPYGIVQLNGLINPLELIPTAKRLTPITDVIDMWLLEGKYTNVSTIPSRPADRYCGSDTPGSFSGIPEWNEYIENVIDDYNNVTVREYQFSNSDTSIDKMVINKQAYPALLVKDYSSNGFKNILAYNDHWISPARLHGRIGLAYYDGNLFFKAGLDKYYPLGVTDDIGGLITVVSTDNKRIITKSIKELPGMNGEYLLVPEPDNKRFNLIKDYQ